jgi:4-hydroxy-tetrahydrodipicolinate synthase
VSQRLGGIVPPLTTPFDAAGELRLDAVRPQVEHMIAAGVHGLAVGGSTGEGHTLDGEELVRLVAAASEAAAGRVPIVAGLIVDSTRDAIRRGRAVRGLGVAALQVTPVHYLFRPTDRAMVDHFAAIADATGLPILIYNVVPWTYLSPALLLRVMEEVPLVVGVKQSAGDLKLLADLMLGVPAGRLVLSAVDALLWSSYLLGAHGSIAAILTAAPHASVALWNAARAGDLTAGRSLHERLLRLWNALVADNLPANCKAALELQGVPAGPPRAPMPACEPARCASIRAALEALGAPLAE